MFGLLEADESDLKSNLPTGNLRMQTFADMLIYLQGRNNDNEGSVVCDEMLLIFTNVSCTSADILKASHILQLQKTSV